MKKIDRKNAEIIYNWGCIESTYDEKIQTPYIACIDDDMISAIYATWLYFKAVKKGNNPKILCIGGLGMLSTYMNIKSEAHRLAYFCRQLGVPEDKLVILCKGKNTGQNIEEIAEEVAKNPGDITFAVTKRLSLRFERSFKCQFERNFRKFCKIANATLPKDYYYVIDQPLSEACNWLNAKATDGGNMMLHELASIYDRCVRNKGGFQVPLDTPVPEDVKKAAEYLEKHFALKNGKRGPREIFQYLKLRLSMIIHTDDMYWAQRKAIAKYRNQFAKEFGIKYPTETKSGTVLPG